MDFLIIVWAIFLAFVAGLALGTIIEHHAARDPNHYGGES